MKPKSVNKLRRSPCAIANTLDLFGDKWTLLVIRDLFRGKSTYGEFASAEEKIPTNLLSERLKRLEAADIISSRVYQQHPVRYTYFLTKRGKDLGEVLLAVARWGKKHVPGVTISPELLPLLGSP